MMFGKVVIRAVSIPMILVIFLLGPVVTLIGNRYVQIGVNSGAAEVEVWPDIWEIEFMRFARVTLVKKWIKTIIADEQTCHP